MAGRWIDITDAYGTRRELLREGLTRVGGGDAEIPLAGAGTDQLHVWDDPPRILFIGSGASPTFQGAPFDERPLRPGDRIDWVGVQLEYGGEAASADQATLEEEPVRAPARVAAPPAGAAITDAERRIFERLRAGLLVDLDKADRRVVKRWQQAVMENRFEADACARELNASGQTIDELAVLERTARLLRDFVMSPLMRGAQGASRRARRAVRGGVAFFVAQAVALLVYSLIVFAAMLLMRIRDVSFDDFLDRILFRH